MPANAVIADELRTQQTRVFRFSTNLTNQVLARLDTVTKGLLARLLDYDPTELTSYGGQQRRIRELRTATSTYLSRQFSAIDDLTTEQATALAQLDTNVVASIVNRTSNAGRGLALMPFSLARTRAIAERAMIMGAPSSEWWSRQKDQLLYDFIDQINQGMSAGDPLTAIARRFRPILQGDQLGPLRKWQRNAEALVRSSVLSINNAARKAQLDESRLVGTVQLLTAFDSRVCRICIPLSGAEFDKRTMKPTADSPYQGKLPSPNPPFHFNCRCIWVPVLRDEQPDQDIYFEDWLKKQSATKQNKILGPTRAEMWRSGNMSIVDLIDQRGRPQTLEQIRAEVA